MGAEGAIKAGEAYVDIGARTGRLDKDLRTVGGKLRAFGTQVRNIGLGIGLMGAPLAAFGVSAIKAAMAYEETVSKFEVVFKEQTAAALAFVNTTSRALGRSRGDLIGYMATLQDTFVPLGFARDDAREFAQQLTKLTIDLGSFNNVADPIVLRDLQSAIVGNHETMRKYGVIITQVALDQELLNMGFAEGAAKASEQQKVLARLNLIMQGTADAQGDAARTAGSVSNQMKALKANIKDLSVEIGQTFLPLVGKTVAAIKDWIKVNPELAHTIGVVGVAVGGLAVAIGVLSVAIWAITLHPLVALVVALAAGSAAVLALGIDALTAGDNLATLGEGFEEAARKAGMWEDVLAELNATGGLDQAIDPFWAEDVKARATRQTRGMRTEADVIKENRQILTAALAEGGMSPQDIEATLSGRPLSGAAKAPALGNLLVQLLSIGKPKAPPEPGMPAPLLNAMWGGITAGVAAFQGLQMGMPQVRTGAVMGSAAELGRMAGVTTQFMAGRGDPALNEAKTSNTWLEKIYGTLETGLGLA